MLYHGSVEHETGKKRCADVPGTIKDTKHKHSKLYKSTRAAVVCLSIILLFFLDSCLTTIISAFW